LRALLRRGRESLPRRRELGIGGFVDGLADFEGNLGGQRWEPIES